MFSSCHSERSRLPSRSFMRRSGGISRYFLTKKIPQHRETSLGMAIRISLGVLITIFASTVAAQESPTPTSSAIPEESPSPLISPEESTTPPPAPEQTPSVPPERNVRISFVPPPMEGTISLGIYDQNGKLVRVLHQEAKLNEFAIGADALVTQWDGKNDDERRPTRWKISRTRLSRRSAKDTRSRPKFGVGDRK